MLSIALVEARDYVARRVGETLTPPAKTMLDHLGLWQSFQACNPVEVHGTAAAWGSSAVHHSDYLFSARGPGWHVDRAAFDGMLARETESRGVRVFRETSFSTETAREEGWELALSGGAEIEASFVVDATGPTAAFARLQGVRSVELDQLVGFARTFEGCAPAEPHTLVESFSDGWWHSATLPAGLRVVTCMTDRDVARGLRLRETDSWERLLATSSTLVAAAVRGGRPLDKLIVRSARSRSLERPVGERWLAAGDAASSFDPLSSQGVVKALRSGIFASYALSDLLRDGDRRGMSRYERYIADEFGAFCDTRGRYYAAERRWPRRDFWNRRKSSGPPMRDKRTVRSPRRSKVIAMECVEAGSYRL
jgi:flavin-dependent dehydrogenase